MFDTAVLTIAGNVVADPKVSGSATNPDRVTFRVVSNRRRRDPETGEWKQLGEFGMNVVCWRKLARGVAQALRRGDPVLVQGRMKERKYTDDNQQTRWVTELTADFVGHDLSQGYASRFSRFTQIDAATARADATGAASDTAGDDADSAAVDDGDESFDFAPTDGFDDVVAEAFDTPETADAAF
jgi:single-strand DNA-binding protein